jgi:uncharacterized protein (DUF305 family)
VGGSGPPEGEALVPSRTRWIIIGSVAILATPVLSACSSTSDSASSHAGTAMSTMATDGARAGDIGFAQMMVPHHEQAVEMADIAQSKTSASTDIKNLAAGVKTAQDPEIQLMKGWLTLWGTSTNSTVSGMDHGSTHGMMNDTDLATLRQAESAAFDRQWLTMMIQHHRGAVTAAQQVLTTSTNPDVKALANAIITSQQAEITTMQQLLDAKK